MRPARIDRLTKVANSKRVRIFGSSGRVLIGCLVCAMLGPGCQQKQTKIAPSEAPSIPVAHPLERVITDFVDFTGRTVPVHSVNIVPRVTGYLTKMPFKEGSEVKAGDLLFEIDPRPYQAQLDQANSQVTLNRAQLELAKSTLARYQALDVSTPGAVSQQVLDQYKASVAEAEARVKAQEKSLEVYKLNKDFTQVISPIDGQVSRYYLTLGNLVNQDQTLLTTVVSLDPIYAYFDMDDRTLIQIRMAINQGKIKPAESGVFPVYLQVEGEEDYPHRGVIDFVNNQVSSSTGSISMRGVFPNPKPGEVAMQGALVAGYLASPLGPGPLLSLLSLLPDRIPSRTTRILSPGLFVRIRLPIGEPHQAMLVIDRAIQSDQGRKFVYVVDKDNVLQMRRIATGALQPDGLRVVSGVKLDDWIVVGALQTARQRLQIKPEHISMPILGGQGSRPSSGASNATPSVRGEREPIVPGVPKAGGDRKSGSERQDDRQGKARGIQE
jgi:multidrug efflux system membrane fusion protein